MAGSAVMLRTIRERLPRVAGVRAHVVKGDTDGFHGERVESSK